MESRPLCSPDTGVAGAQISKTVVSQGTLYSMVNSTIIEEKPQQ